MDPAAGEAGQARARAASRAGRRTYQAFCGTCHGENRQGDPLRTVPSLDGIESRLSRTRGRRDHRERPRPDAVVQGDPGRRPRGADRLPVPRRAAAARRRARENDPPRTSSTPTPATTASSIREGYPAVKPPWGTLNAIDLNNGTIAWRVTLGEYPELTKRGIPPTGTRELRRPGGHRRRAVFIGATKDEKIRAFDAATGKTLWEAPLPAAAHATPAVYAVDGKQYVVIAAGGGKGTQVRRRLRRVRAAVAPGAALSAERVRPSQREGGGVDQRLQIRRQRRDDRERRAGPRMRAASAARRAAPGAETPHTRRAAGRPRSPSSAAPRRSDRRRSAARRRPGARGSGAAAR